jgi:decaprenylphospho-beta-D-ribofuranose 2-oxidase
MTLDGARVTRVTGYGMASGADGYLFRPATEAQIAECFELARRTGRRVTLRGAGRSYGDANYSAENLIVDLTRFDRILDWDPASGLIQVEGGTSLMAIWHKTLEDGWWLPVVSGTSYPTIAGALAMNIHGKNNFCMGTLGEHVRAIDVMIPSGEVRSLCPGDPLFRAVIGGAGLLAVILRVTLQMKRVTSGDVIVHAASVPCLEAQFETFERFQPVSDYMVSWVDCFARGKGLGRGLFHSADYPHLDAPDQASLKIAHQQIPDTVMGLLPKAVLWRFLKPLNRRSGMRFVNWAKYTMSKVLGGRGPHHQSLAEYSFLLDAVPDWRKAYLPDGFVQYQIFVPRAEAPRVFRRVLEMQQDARYESFLGVMKRHRPDPFLVSCNLDGYSFAMDFKVRRRRLPELQQLARRMTDVALDAGGRFYFAKDSLLGPADAVRYLGPALDEFRRVRAEADPEGLLTSALAVRLEL